MWAMNNYDKCSKILDLDSDFVHIIGKVSSALNSPERPDCIT